MQLILSDTNFLSEFWATLLSSGHHSLLVPQSVGESYDRPKKDSILKFILSSALLLSPYGVLKVLSLLKGLGSQVLLIKEVDSLLKDLLGRRNKSHHQTLSRVEVKILCLLLELTSAAGVHAVDSFILKSL